MIETGWSVSCELPTPRTRKERRVYRRVRRVLVAWAKHVGKPLRYRIYFDRIVMPQFEWYQFPPHSVIDDPVIQKELLEWLNHEIKPLERTCV